MITSVIGVLNNTAFQDGVDSNAICPSLMTRNRATGVILLSDYDKIRLITPFCPAQSVYNVDYETCVTSCVGYNYFYSFKEENCGDLKCYDIFYAHWKVCSSHGYCAAPDVCQCNDGYSGDNCEFIDKLNTTTGVTIKNVTSNSFVISWNRVNLATSYIVSISNGLTNIENVTSQIFFMFSSLNQSTTYNITIKAKSSISESDVITVTAKTYPTFTDTVKCNGIVYNAGCICHCYQWCPNWILCIEV